MSYPQLKWSLLNQVRGSRSRRKALAHRLGFLFEGIERLEERQTLSPLHLGLPSPVIADYATIKDSSDTAERDSDRKADRHQDRSAQMYPSVAGVWNLTAAADIDDDPTLDFSGTVMLTQNGRKIGGSVRLDGLPTFKIHGKLDQSETFQLNGSTRFPIEVSDNKFHFLRGRLTVSFAPDVETFKGSVHRVIFGHHIDIALSATKV